jgi:hypothetical protein
MSESEERSPRWLSALLVLIALGGLGFAIYRYVDYEKSKTEPEPTPSTDSEVPKGGAPFSKQLIPPDKSKFKEKEKAKPDTDRS